MLRTRARGCLGTHLGFEVCFWWSYSVSGELGEQGDASIPPQIHLHGIHTLLWFHVTVFSLHHCCS